MDTFLGYDNALCDNEACSRKKRCMRYLTQLKAKEEGYPYPISYMINDEKKCIFYVEDTDDSLLKQ